MFEINGASTESQAKTLPESDALQKRQRSSLQSMRPLCLDGVCADDDQRAANACTHKPIRDETISLQNRERSDRTDWRVLGRVTVERSLRFRFCNHWFHGLQTIEFLRRERADSVYGRRRPPDLNQASLNP